MKRNMRRIKETETSNGVYSRREIETETGVHSFIHLEETKTEKKH